MHRPLTIERETAILDAAQRRFAHYGINKVTMDEVSADVGLKKASLYYYFKTKEDLFTAVIEREEKGYLAVLQNITGQRILPARKLHLFGTKRLELFASLLNLAQFKSDSWITIRPEFQQLFRKLEAEEHHFLTGILHEGVKRGEFVLKDPASVATLILHLLQGLRLRVVKHSQTPASAAEHYAELGREVRDLLDLLLLGFTNHKRSTHTSRTVHA
jgi:TetR/AcrR family transcriptional regulator